LDKNDISTVRLPRQSVFLALHNIHIAMAKQMTKTSKLLTLVEN